MQSRKQHDPRILAIDLRPQQFGYAVFEGPKRLLDWGVAYYRPGGKEGAVVAGRRVAEMVRMFLPSVIVVKKVRQKIARDSYGAQPILRVIRRKAAADSISLRLISRRDVREAFGIFRGNTKYEIACNLTVIFPELLWKLPPKRKLYESEHPSMTTFDAIALGFTYWEHNGTEILSQK